MATLVYRDAVKEFENALFEVDRYLRFVAAANQLRPWIGKMVIWDDLQSNEKDGLQRFVDCKDYRPEVGHNGLVIAIGAAFEHLVRRIVKEGVIWINGKIDDYGRLTQSLLQQNLIRSGHALTTIAEPPVEMAYDYEAICQNLGTCRRGGGMLILNADAFSISITNVTQKRITESLARIGIEIDWDFFGRNQPLQVHFNTRPGRRTTDEVEKYLKTFVVLRNRIAHSGFGVHVSQSEVETALKFFGLFGPLLAEATESVLKRQHK